MAVDEKRNIPLSPEVTRLLEQTMASGQFASPDEALKAGLQLLSHKSDDALKTAAELRETQERFAKAFNASPHLLAISTFEGGRYLDVNESVLRKTGYSREEFIGSSDVSLDLYVNLADRTTVRDLIIRDGFVREFEVKLRAKNGRVLTVMLSTEIVHVAGVKCILATSVDVTERREAEQRAEQHRRLLLDELNHRVKNTLATVQSIARQTLRMAETPADFIAGFSARLMALARAHDLLTRREWQAVSLGDLVRRTVAPYGTSRIAISGEAFDLPPNTAVVLNMVLHELATNAAKYGALSKDEGALDIAWTIDRTLGAEPRLTVEWTERGGPTVGPRPARVGFGTRLIERSLAAELGGAATLDFNPEGLRCSMQLFVRPAWRTFEETHAAR